MSAPASTAAPFAEKVSKAKPSHESAQTMFRIVSTQFAEHRMAMVGLATILILSIIALSAPLIESLVGIGPDDQNVFQRYRPIGSTIESPADAKEFAIEGYIKQHSQESAALTADLKAKALIPAETADEDALYDFVLNAPSIDQPLADLATVGTPAAAGFSELLRSFRVYHWLGTDELGRDVLMRLVYGARVSIGVGILSALASALIGLLIGTVAGYYGGWIDAVLSRVTDALLALPLLPLMIIFAAINLSEMPFLSTFISGKNESIAKLVVIIVIFSWMAVARLVRGSILSIKQREYVMAAKTLGAGDRRTIVSHIIPNVIAPLLVAVTLGVGQAILFESALSFLGLGIQPPTPSWGNMLFNAQELLSQSPLLAIFPGLLIFLSVVSFNFVGDGLQDAIDPKTIKR